MAKSSKAQQIRSYLVSNPDASPADVAKKFKSNTQYIYVIRSMLKKQKKAEGLNIDSVHAGTITFSAPKVDMVNHPPHYTDGGIETIDFIDAKKLDYHLGNVVKYITRADKKNGMEDLKKAQWYLNRAIEKRSNA